MPWGGDVVGGDALHLTRHHASEGETLLSLTDFITGDIKGTVGGDIVQWKHCLMRSCRQTMLWGRGCTMRYHASQGWRFRVRHSVMMRDGNVAKISIASCHDEISFLRGGEMLWGRCLGL